jgi:hypothetical protein
LHLPASGTTAHASGRLSAARPAPQTLHLNRVLRHNVRTAMFEGSTHYAREGHRVTPHNRTFAASLYEASKRQWMAALHLSGAACWGGT